MMLTFKAIRGLRYDVATLVLAGWTVGDGTGFDGLCWLSWFDASGVYLGPDDKGREPVLARCA